MLHVMHVPETCVMRLQWRDDIGWNDRAVPAVRLIEQILVWAASGFVGPEPRLLPSAPAVTA